MKRLFLAMNTRREEVRLRNDNVQAITPTKASSRQERCLAAEEIGQSQAQRGALAGPKAPCTCPPRLRTAVEVTLPVLGSEPRASNL